jgi:hypothetical protein
VRPDSYIGGVFGSVAASAAEVASSVPGDDIVDPADVVMDRAFTVPGTPEQVWPWIEQLGKGRAGWYLPARVERLVPRSRRALRRIDGRWLGLVVGDRIPDYGGRREYFEVAEIDRPHHLVHRSERGRVRLSWAIALVPEPTGRGGTVPSTRVRLRLRLAPVRHRWLTETVGDWFDGLTVAGLAAGLRERLAGQSPSSARG